MAWLASYLLLIISLGFRAITNYTIILYFTFILTRIRALQTLPIYNKAITCRYTFFLIKFIMLNTFITSFQTFAWFTIIHTFLTIKVSYIDIPFNAFATVWYKSNKLRSLDTWNAGTRGSSIASLARFWAFFAFGSIIIMCWVASFYTNRFVLVKNKSFYALGARTKRTHFTIIWALITSN